MMLKPPPLSKRVFDKYDNNKSGKISASEFHNLCYDMGYFLSDKERELAIMQIDTYVGFTSTLFLILGSQGLATVKSDTMSFFDSGKMTSVSKRFSLMKNTSR